MCTVVASTVHDLDLVKDHLFNKKSPKIRVVSEILCDGPFQFLYL